MMPLKLEGGSCRPSRLLVVGSHADDIEIGCGGTVLKLVRTSPGLEVWWVVLSAAGERAAEAQASAGAFLEGVERRRILVDGFRDGFFPYEGSALKERFEELKREFTPDLVLTHYRGDLHQDHRLVSELTWNTFRDQLILEYEIPKYDGDLGIPNVFVHLDEATCQQKVDALLRYFPSQRNRRWFTSDLFLSLMRLRGMEANAPSRYAEAFHGRKVVISMGET
jgi:LmbE family N-acetylglucosaminyl deacetylase